jgi:hypothetical protein
MEHDLLESVKAGVARGFTAMRAKSKQSSVTTAAVLSALAGVLAVGVIILAMIGVVGTGSRVHEPGASTASAPRPVPSGTTGQSMPR